MDGTEAYIPNKFNFRSNTCSLDINTIVNMNRIMRNLYDLSKYNKKCTDSPDYIYNKYKTPDINFNAKECRNLWNINENEPIDIINICLNKFKNITIVFFTANENMSGASNILNGEIIIFVNSNHTLGRQRFTIAHELYHILYGNNEFIDCSLRSNSKIEEDADKFASKLLMSDSALFNYERENNISKWNLDEIIDCEQYFQISRKAILNRLLTMNRITEKEYVINSKKIKYNAKKRGYDVKLYNPYLKDKNLLMGHYIKLAQEAYEDKKINKKEMENILKDAFYDDFLNNEDMKDLIE